MDYLTAQVTDVAIGNFTIAGLMDEQGNYYVGVPQVTEEFSFDTNQASRTIKSLLGKDYEKKSFDKLKTSLNSKPINAIPLEDFEKVIVGLAKKGNQRATEIAIALVGLSLHQLFSDAFNISFEKEERQKFLKRKTQQEVTIMSVSLNSIRAICDIDYPVEYAVKYIAIGSDKIITTSATTYQTNPLDDESYKSGYKFECVSDDSKSWDIWEVVFADLFIPQYPSNRTYTGIIICGCKLVNSRPVEESDKTTIQIFDDWDENDNPIFKEIEVYKS